VTSKILQHWVAYIILNRKYLAIIFSCCDVAQGNFKVENVRMDNPPEHAKSQDHFP
jgi:hypothetical protein